MSHSHKEKERLRHQKQVKLLNNIMEYIPKIANEPQTKVRKLRRLVLYTHYLRMVHSKLTGELYSHAIYEEKNCDKNASVKPVSGPVKKPSQSKRKSRAHIVFLHADKSASNMNNDLKKSTVHSAYTETQRDNEESSTVPSSNYEYKVPEVVPIDSGVSIYCDQEGTHISDDVYEMQLINDCSISSHQCQVSPESITSNNEKSYSELESHLSENIFYKGKENYKPVVDNAAINSKEKEFLDEYSLYDRLTQSIVKSEENLRGSEHRLDNFHTHLQDDCDSHVLKDLEFSNVENKDFSFSQLSNLGNRREYVLNSNGSNSIQNVATGYGFHGLPAKLYQNSVSYCDSLYNPSFSLNSESRQPVYCDQFSMTRNASECSSSSTSTDKTNIDNENLSDSNPSCNVSDSSNSSQYHYYDYYTNSFCNSSEFPENQGYLTDGSIKYDPMGIHPEALFQSNYNYMGSNNVLMNGTLLNQMYDTSLPHFGSVYPSSINFNRNSNCPAAFQSDSIRALCNKTIESKTSTDYDSLYSPSLCDSIHSEEFSLSQPKTELTNFSYPPEPFSSESNRPRFFEEEISYPLVQFLGNCS